MDHGREITDDSESMVQYKVSIGPDFRYRSRVTYHVTSNQAEKAVTLKFYGVMWAMRLYVIWIELDET